MSIPEWDNRVFLPVWISKPRPVLSFPEKYRALVDTGATNSMISSEVIRELSLPVIDRVAYSSASESNKETTLHFVRLNIDPASGGKDDFAIGVARMGSHPSHFQVLLGMDVLSSYELRISRGELSLKRLPSS